MKGLVWPLHIILFEFWYLHWKLGTSQGLQQDIFGNLKCKMRSLVGNVPDTSDGSLGAATEKETCGLIPPLPGLGNWLNHRYYVLRPNICRSTDVPICRKTYQIQDKVNFLMQNR